MKRKKRNGKDMQPRKNNYDKMSYYLLFIAFCLSIFIASSLLVVTIIPFILGSDVFLPGLCVSVVILGITFLCMLPEIIRYKDISTGKEGKRGKEWSSECSTSLSTAFMFLGFTVFIGLALIVNVGFGYILNWAFVFFLILFVFGGTFAYTSFKEIITLWNYKFKIFSYENKREPKDIVVDILQKEGVTYGFERPSKRTIPHEFDTILKTNMGFNIRMKKMYYKRCWISIGPKNKRNKEIIHRIMRGIDLEFGR